jgi:hypothetical protein
MSFWQARTKIDAADRLFSQFIRERDGNRCQSCGADGRLTQLECSHFFGRRMESVRFDQENADAFCRTCHQIFEPQKGFVRSGVAGTPDAPAPYRAWKMAHLGAKRFAALEVRAHTTAKKDRKMMLLYVKSLIAELRKTRPGVVG